MMIVLICVLIAVVSASSVPALPTSQSDFRNATNSTLDLPPNRFVYHYDTSHEVIFYRDSTSHSSGNYHSGVSIHNWEQAVADASYRIIHLQQWFKAPGSAPFPNNRFIDTERLMQPSSRHWSEPRMVRFDIQGVSNLDPMKYDDIQMIMLGLLAYGDTYKIGRREQVKMCRFAMYWLELGNFEIVNGSVSLVISRSEGNTVAES